MNFRPPKSVRPHWNYFLALEKDLEVVSRYIEFSRENLNTYSIELAHLLLSAASEVDTLAKCVCTLLDPKEEARNINDYRRIIKAAEESETYCFNGIPTKLQVLKEEHKQRLSALRVYVPRYNLTMVPWKDWAEQDKNPEWWHSYNKVKHERNLYFNKATLGNALNALGALLAMNYVHCRFELSKPHQDQLYDCKGKRVTRYLMPHSTFLQFQSDFYDNPIAELGGYISSVSEDVERLSGEISDLRP